MEREDPAGEQRQRRVGQDLLLAELAEQPRRARAPAADESRLPRRSHGCHGGGDVPGGQPVADRGLGLAVLLEPRRGGPVQVRDEFWLVPDELGAQEFGEQVVVSVPLAVIVERGHEQTLARRALQLIAGVVPAGDRPAQVGAETFEDRRVLQERPHVLRQPRQHLRGQVASDLALIAPQVRQPLLGRQRLGEDRREVDPSRPALGDVHDGGESLRVGQGSVKLQQLGGLVRIQGEPFHAHLRQTPGGPQPGQRQRRVPAPGQRDRPSRRQLLHQRRDRVPAPPAAHVVAVVEDQHERGSVADRRREQRARAVLPARVALPKQREHGRRDVGDRRDRRRQVGQKDGRVGVGRLQRDPRDRPSLGLGPLDQRARLAAAGRGGEHHQRGLHVQQPVHQGAALHEREVGARGPELVLQQWDAEHLTLRIRLLRATRRTPPD